MTSRTYHVLASHKQEHHRRGIHNVHMRSQMLIHACTQDNPRFVEHADASVVSSARSLAFSRPAIVRVSPTSSPNEVVLTCLMSLSHLSHLSSRLSQEVRWNWKTSLMSATPAVWPKRSRILPYAIMPFLSLRPCFTSSFARPEVVAASIL